MKKCSQRLFVCLLPLFLIMITGCTIPPAQKNNTPSQITPLALSPDTTRSTTPLNDSDWPTYHKDNVRSGSVENTPDPHQLTKAWSMQLDGAVYAEPLVVGGHVIVATEGDTIYALDRQTGHIQWQTNVGSPVSRSTLPCGNIDPLGITGTPVYDPTTGLIFAVAEIQGPAHILVGLDNNTGQVLVRRLVDIPSMDPQVHQQRAALALSQNMVYIAYGGLDGDCGNYHGTIVASQTDGNGPLLSFQVPTPREGGIWAASGPAIDSTGHVYVSVGNGETTSGAWDHSDSVLRLSPTLQLEDGFAPTQWQQDNDADADLGSMGPILLPDGLVFADGKSGLGYLLHANALGGVGGQALVKPLCYSFGGAAVLGSLLFVPCTDGLRQIQIGPGAQFSLGWQAPSQINGSPVIGGHTVYSLNPAGTLYALDIDSGAVRSTLSVDATSRFATPTISANQIFVGTLTGVIAATLS